MAIGGHDLNERRPAGRQRTQHEQHADRPHILSFPQDLRIDSMTAFRSASLILSVGFGGIGTGP